MRCSPPRGRIAYDACKRQPLAHRSRDGCPVGYHQLRGLPLLSIGRLSGIKQKDPRRAGKSQWLVDPESVSREEKHRETKLVLRAQHLKRA